MDRERTWKTIITFRTTTQAIIMENQCRKQNLPGRLIPVPREISAGCGMAWSAPLESRKVLEDMLEKEKVAVEGIYEILL